MFDFSIFLVVNSWGHLPLLSADDTDFPSASARFSLLWDDGLRRCCVLPMFWRRFCCTGNTVLTERFADLESHWRDNQAQCYSHLPYNSTGAELIKRKSPKGSLHWWRRTFPEAVRLLKENWPSSLWVVGQGSTKAPHTMKEIATAAGCMSGHGKRRRQKTLHRHTLTTGQGKTKVGLKQKLPFHCWLS